jgi:P27 family predicted phage terminase small subunit
MARGRKPLPSHLKLVKGTARGKLKQTRSDSIQAAPALPDPPPHLNEDAKAEWARVAPMLYAQRVLALSDVAALGAYCQAYAIWKQATDALNVMSRGDALTKALMIKTTNGNAIQNPLLGIANKAASDMVRFAAEFGMTPSARARINLGTAAPVQDPADDFFA